MFISKKKKRARRFPPNWFANGALLVAILLSVVVTAQYVVGETNYGVRLSWLRWSPDSADLAFRRDAVVSNEHAKSLVFRWLETYQLDATGQNVKNIDPADLVAYTASQGSALRDAQSPDGRWSATIEDDELTISGPDPGDTYHNSGHLWLIGWSSDSAYLAFRSYGGISDRLIIFTTKQRGFYFVDRFDDISDASWSPDGQHIAVIDNDNESIWLVEVPAGSVRRIFKDPPGGLLKVRHYFFQAIAFCLPSNSWMWGCCPLPSVWAVTILFVIYNRSGTTVDQQETPKRDQEIRAPHLHRFPANWFVISVLLFAVLHTVVGSSLFLLVASEAVEDVRWLSDFDGLALVCVCSVPFTWIVAIMSVIFNLSGTTVERRETPERGKEIL